MIDKRDSTIMTGTADVG